ncbi:MAG: DUF695 domain-containing protein [Sulfurimonas sp.]|uniref:DUF695 domain-containing protein n=1 Tax=Sulfurimonas sp. TaxID=2022749 RepID=UPI0026220316|nr:DUF695 domain-containing protein [Sulfurimonas sp.]MDD2653318.1 DUF695 domain-containing protein [Sulfurimonas sp.]MDD3450705.1 DUF695 domain-containing protein [Sulfurimonas sp.]
MREIFSRVEENSVVAIETEVDLECDKKSFPWLLSVFIKAIGSNEGFDALETFLETKESLILALEHNGSAFYVGSREHDGWRELYFYVKSAKNLETVVTKMLSQSGCKFESSIVKDAKWDFYHKNLYPTELEFHHIESDKIIALLEEEGDMLKASREVEHYVSFDTQTQKERFSQNVLESGFAFKDDISSEEFEYGVAVVKNHPVTKEAVAKVVQELYELLKKEHGYYEGWSTVLVDTQS